MQKPWIAKCWQFITFGIVGVSNTLISLAVYQIALNALGMHYLAANALDWSSAWSMPTTGTTAASSAAANGRF